MHRTLIAVLALSACAPEAARDAPPAAGLAAAGSAAPAAEESGTFRMLRGDSTLATARFQRTPQRLRSEITGDPGGARVEYTADLNADATVSRMEARIFAGSAEPRARVDLTFRGDSVFMESVQDGE